MARKPRLDQKRYDPILQDHLQAINAPVVSLAESQAKRPAPPLDQQLTARPPKSWREKRVLLTPEEEQALERQIQQLAAELGTPLKLSHVLRGLIHLFAAAQDQVLSEAGIHPPLSRPPNGDTAALAEFEKHVAAIFYRAFRAWDGTSAG